MVSKTNEQALESAIERALTGTCLEDLTQDITIVAESLEPYGSPKNYYLGDTNNFSAKYALDEYRFWHFLETTQQEELCKIQRSADWKLRILERFDRLAKKHGILHLLKKGLSIDDAHFTLLYLPPMASSSPSVIDNYRKNEFSITRQIRYNLDNPREEIDMVVFINGIAIATIELKNPWTGQTARFHGIKQYKQDRDTKQPLLNFGRCIVHLSVDTDEVYMTTKLAGNGTFFLPLNKGNKNGKGNPINPNGHKSAYLWEEILAKDSLVNIVQHFVRFDGDEKDPLSKRTLFFPRYHQLDVVRKLITDVCEKGVGQSYLIQHSAGSGKSNSITWAAYQLIEAYPNTAEVAGHKDLKQPIFDSVLVVTDRRILNRQLKDNIRQFSEVKNIIAKVDSSRDLKESLEQGKKIIITTIQKFPFIVEGIADLSDRNFAVIIDEAHGSQSGVTAGKMNQAMGGMANDTEEEADTQDLILNAIKARKTKSNASYFAFTATPKNATLERFGTQQADGSFEPFHLYSMKQAIEEGFILDVLSNYTTYKSYYEVQKSIEDNPKFDTKRAQGKLRAYVERNKQTIGTKAEIMLDHFISNVFNSKKLKGHAKGMVVTQSIESAIRYYLELKKLLEKKNNPFKLVIAFSGTKEVDGVEYTEAGMNGFSDNETKEYFDKPEYRLLVVANKYLTGFDQPKLCTMYVDKKLQGVLAVQALSRLNRSANKYGKKKEDLFVLDFFNTIDEIKSSFDPFYTSTSLSEATDINVLHELKEHLDDEGVYEWSEVENFNEKFFKGVDAQELSPIIEVSAERFNKELGLEDEKKADYKIKAKQFVKIYGQVSSIMPFEMVKWEQLFWFLKFLVPKLVVKRKEDELLDELLESVDLSNYGVERTKVSVAVGLDESETVMDPQNPNPRGSHGGDSERDVLSEIVNTFNERWFSGWDSTPEEQRIKFITTCQGVVDHKDYITKVAENPDPQNRELAFIKILDEVMNNQRRKELELYKLYAKDEAFKSSLLDSMKMALEKGIVNRV